MNTKTDNMETESVRIDTGVLELVRLVKQYTGIPMGRFIEESIALKISKLPKKVQEKIMGSKIITRKASR